MVRCLCNKDGSAKVGIFSVIAKNYGGINTKILINDDGKSIFTHYLNII